MKKVLGWGLWLLVLLVIGLPSLEGTAEGGVVFVGLYVVLSGMIYLCVRGMGKRKALKQTEKAEREKKVAAGVLPVHVHSARHEAGLPVSQGLPCEVRVFVDRLEFFAGGQVYQIPVQRLTGAQEYNDTEMRQDIRSSAFQTILGAAAFGGVGAVVGAMPESKYRREVSKYNLAVSFVAEEGSASAVVLSADVSLGVLGHYIRQYSRGTGPKEAVTL